MFDYGTFVWNSNGMTASSFEISDNGLILFSVIYKKFMDPKDNIHLDLLQDHESIVPAPAVNVRQEPNLLDVDDDGNTLLHWAVIKGPDVVEQCLAKGLDVNQQNNLQETPLIWAVGRGEIASAKLLIDRNADTNLVLDGRSLAHVAANCPNQAMLPFLHAYINIDLKHRDNSGRTLISYAAQCGNHLTTEWLLRKGANPLLGDDRKNIPLHFAAHYNNSRTVYTLLEYGPPSQIDFKNDDYESPLELVTILDTDKDVMLSTKKRNENCCYYNFDQCTDNEYRLPSTRRFTFYVMWYFLVNQLLAVLHIYFFIKPNLDLNENLYYAFFGLAALAVITYFIIKNSNPGIVKNEEEVSRENHNEPILRGDLYNSLLRQAKVSRLCITLEIVMPWRAKYCKEVGAVIDRFDHYCPWTGNAIGRKNYRLFVLYMLLETTCLLSYLYLYYRYSTSGNFHDIGKILGMILMVQALGLSIHNSILFTIHLYLISNNLTTSDFLKWWKYPYLTLNGEFQNAFDFGFCNNWCQFLSANYGRYKKFEDWSEYQFPSVNPHSPSPCLLFRWLLGG